MGIGGGGGFPWGKAARAWTWPFASHLVPRSRMVELYLYSLLYLHGITFFKTMSLELIPQRPQQMYFKTVNRIHHERQWGERKLRWNCRRQRIVTSKTCLPPSFTLVSCSAYSSTPKTEATDSSETSIDLQRDIWRYIPGDRTICVIPSLPSLILPCDETSWISATAIRFLTYIMAVLTIKNKDCFPFWWREEDNV
jgi:hypothetical protein